MQDHVSDLELAVGERQLAQALARAHSPAGPGVKAAVLNGGGCSKSEFVESKVRMSPVRSVRKHS